MKNIILIKDNFIELGKLIKKAGFVSTGGQVKDFLLNNNILINGKKPIGRSTKVFTGFVIYINDQPFLIEKIDEKK
ncbi:RNA-binding S4 domain-containing protein [Mycoplasma sp. Mirounga ES2805-ORL]|uniref:RNA-binding S4 domain-containing protein n=1 Tax=Mycoplasma sp. Mirounga ES2805-ORL TaxID=754514 RepID=UPI00197C4F3A|nr:RNA-binding S4 domain-containing protein [Mycoplasma sp. Mirounga ES2805-ORL]QSF13510.1 RNA-binding S4 domain-containing protein [Mycoplasma sp. Mirounga ES2805-ORL]